MSQAGRGYPAATSSLSTSMSMSWVDVPSAAGFRGYARRSRRVRRPVTWLQPWYLGVGRTADEQISPDFCNLRRQTLRSAGARWGTGG